MKGDYTKMPKPKPAHTDQSLPPCVVPLSDDMKYVVVRFDGKVYGAVDTLHEAAWIRERARRRSNKNEWLETLYVPESAIRYEDMVFYND